MVTAFRNRPLDGGPNTYVWIDALTQKVRGHRRLQHPDEFTQLVPTLLEILRLIGGI